jgi:zona occludens toxin
VIELITGTPGAGKTLMTVGRVLRPMVGATLRDSDGKEHLRRLCIGGIPDLLLPHELLTVKAFDPEKGGEPSDGRERKPGEPPLPDVEMRADNWWQWCLPGDVIVVDECQRLFRPMASGRKLPLFIAMLETHRHYGIDMVLITQHPQLIHSNVRALVGKHRDVRRLFGGFQRMVYEWDRCSSVERRKDATAVPWRPDKSVYSLYKSSEIHTKQKFSIPLPLIVAGVMVFGLPAALWAAYSRVTGAFSGERQAKSAPAPVRAASSADSANAVHRPSYSADSAIMKTAAFPLAESASEPESDKGKLSGCIAIASKCSCFDKFGYFVKVEPDICRHSSREYGKLIPYPVFTDSPRTVPALYSPAVSASAPGRPG